MVIFSILTYNLDPQDWAIDSRRRVVNKSAGPESVLQCIVELCEVAHIALKHLAEALIYRDI